MVAGQLLLSSGSQAIDLNGHSYELTYTGSLFLGEASVVVGNTPGIANLDIQGGRLVSESAVVGAIAGSNGHLTLHGITWENISPDRFGILFGLRGRAEVELYEGTTLSSDWLRLGYAESSYGRLSVNGTGTAVDITRFFEINSGELRIENGATFSGRSIILESAAAATIVVTGQGSALTDSGFEIASYGTGAVYVRDGGRIEAFGIGIARNRNGASGLVAVEDATLSLSYSMEVGGQTYSDGSAFAGSVGELSIGNHGDVQVATKTMIWDYSTLRIDNGQLTTGQYVQRGTLDLTLSDMEPSMHVTGSATLGGSLTIQVDEDAVFTDGQQITLMTYGSHTGQFSSVSLPPDPSPTLEWRLRYLPTSIVLALSSFPLRGDANADGQVDEQDAAVLISNFGASATTWETGDFDGDGRTTIKDLTLLQQNFGLSSNSAAITAVPEASTLTLIAFPLASVIVVQFRRHSSNRILSQRSKRRAVKQ